jgi:hypothetical protein
MAKKSRQLSATSRRTIVVVFVGILSSIVRRRRRSRRRRTGRRGKRSQVRIPLEPKQTCKKKLKKTKPNQNQWMNEICKFQEICRWPWDLQGMYHANSFSPRDVSCEFILALGCSLGRSQGMYHVNSFWPWDVAWDVSCYFILALGCIV